MSAALFWILVTNPACLFFGYLFGRATRAVVRIEEQMVDGDLDPDIEESQAQQAARRKLRQTITPLRIISAVIVLIGLTTVYVGYSVTRNQDRLTGCIIGYSNAAADASKAARVASQEANAQLDAVFEAILQAYTEDPATGGKRVRDAIESYADSRRKVRESQAANPLPDAPRDACAELQ